MEKIDAHVHVWIPENQKYPYWIDRPDVHYYDGSVELLLELMDKNGISKAVLIQPSQYGWDNSYIMDCVDAHPDRLAAIVRVDQWSKSGPADLEYWVKERGAQGVRLTLWEYTAESWNHGLPEYPLWEKIRELGVVAGYLIEPFHAPMIEDMLNAFPEVPVILDHLGKPITSESPDFPSFQNILDLARYPQVYIKLSAMSYQSNEDYPHRDLIACAEKAVRAYEPNHVMWATDFCFTLGAHNYHQGNEIVEKYMPFIGEQDKEWIFAKTARKLFRFGEK
jgi:predicted TIM-barrel fold metal-dependent hydrolase